MKTRVLFFGQLVDITGTEELQLDRFADTETLTASLHQQFPALAQSKYVIAVNQEMISGHTILQDNSTVALLPPFSGG